MKIKEWAEEDRPREKMLLKGIASLSDAELLAILIGSGNSRETAVQLSQRILNSVNNNLNALGKLSVKELMFKFKGIGKVKAITINAANLGNDVATAIRFNVPLSTPAAMFTGFSIPCSAIFPTKNYGSHSRTVLPW